MKAHINPSGKLLFYDVPKQYRQFMKDNYQICFTIGQISLNIHLKSIVLKCFARQWEIFPLDLVLNATTLNSSNHQCLPATGQWLVELWVAHDIQLKSNSSIIYLNSFQTIEKCFRKAKKKKWILYWCYCKELKYKDL